MSLNANLIKELREKSGAGIVDCKNALLQNDNDIEKSIDWLRKKGLSVAAKKSGRIAAEGLVGVHIDNNQACLIEINSETDFVSRNEQFQKFVNDCSKIATTTDGDLDSLLKSKFFESDNTVEDELTKNIATIGENLNIRRLEKITLDGPGSIVSYVHNSVSENLGKIAVILSLKSNANQNSLESIGKKIAMHIAASNPLAINKDGIKKEIIDKELEIIKAEITNSGKPAEMAEKISKGKISKFINDNTLLNQIWIMDPKKKVSDILKENKVDKEIKILDFIRYKVGEGV